MEDEKFKLFLKSIGKNIRVLREKQGFTILEISQKTGISEKYLCKIEEGKAYNLKLCTHLSRISFILKTDISEILRLN